MQQQSGGTPRPRTGSEPGPEAGSTPLTPHTPTSLAPASDGLSDIRFNSAAAPDRPVGGPHGPADGEQPVVVDRRDGPHGEVVLRRHGPLLQIIANGTFLMDTSDGRSERLLVRAALDELRRGPHREAPRLLIGGLGVGFSLAEAAREPEWGGITVVEREEAVVDWHREGGPLSELTADALRDPRTRIVHADLAGYLRGVTHNEVSENASERDAGPAYDGTSQAPGGPLFDALCLDVDNGPEWTVTEDNASLYSPAGLAACRARLAPGGVLAIWSAQSSPTFEEALRNAGFERVRTEEIPVARGVPDVVHFATKPA